MDEPDIVEIIEDILEGQSLEIQKFEDIDSLIKALDQTED